MTDNNQEDRLQQVDQASNLILTSAKKAATTTNICKTALENIKTKLVELNRKQKEKVAALKHDVDETNITIERLRAEAIRYQEQIRSLGQPMEGQEAGEVAFKALEVQIENLTKQLDAIKIALADAINPNEIGDLSSSILELFDNNQEGGYIHTKKRTYTRSRSKTKGSKRSRSRSYRKKSRRKSK